MDVWTALSLTYLWIKAGHVIFVIFWIAGLFLLPRFYVYHMAAAPGSAAALADPRAAPHGCMRPPRNRNR